MNAKSIGATIQSLRKQHKMTQMQLAELLNVSDKTVSKWEAGAGFPEVTQFPKIASIFKVSVDYLMSEQKKGIAIAGNIIADLVKSVDCYPEKGMLANIKNIKRAVGGCVPNTAIDIVKMDPSVPVTALGKVGDDEYGQFVVSSMQKYGVRTEKILSSPTLSTSFCDVMSLPQGERTFFSFSGANKEFGPEDIDIASLNCSIFHIGYIFLLEKFDKEDAEYGTVMARFLKTLQEVGIKTSIDAVSSSTGDYKSKLLPPLKYCNYVIMNEIECCGIWGIEPYDKDGKLNVDNIKLAMSKMIAEGVKEKVVIHCKEGGFCLDSSGEFTSVVSLKIPDSEIRGKTGAGDAFCAACLYGLYNGYSDSQMLNFAACAAACNLMAEDSVSGMKTKDEVEKMATKYERMVL